MWYSDCAGSYVFNREERLMTPRTTEQPAPGTGPLKSADESVNDTLVHDESDVPGSDPDEPLPGKTTPSDPVPGDAEPDDDAPQEGQS
jgi:hypothetical protein